MQAIINNLAPLLFLTFQREFDVSLERIGLLITVNFGVQMLTDTAAARYADRIGYRACVLAAHACSAAGLICMGTLPFVMGNAFAGLVIAMILGTCGGGTALHSRVPHPGDGSLVSDPHSVECCSHY